MKDEQADDDPAGWGATHVADQPVAAALDSEGWPEILGTIAGDDNLLVICPDKKMAHQLALRIQGLRA